MPSFRRIARAVLSRLGGRSAVRIGRGVELRLVTIWGRFVKTPLNLVYNKNRAHRRLEIGAGGSRAPGFETLDIVGGRNVDYVLDASKRLPFADSTFELIYASHVLEHIPWYFVEDVLGEWCRVLKRGGNLEIWVPDGLKICKALVDAEVRENNYIYKDGWYKFNPRRDPCVWAAGRLFTYGDGDGDPKSSNWHRALFTARYLRAVLKQVGLLNIRELERSEVRGYDHGWINLGLTGTKS